MKKNFKRTLSLILAVLMVITAVPLSGLATDTACTHADVTVTQIGTNRHNVICNNVDCDYAVLKEECYSTDDGDGTCESPILCDVCGRRLGTVEHNFDRQVEVEAALVEAVACNLENHYYKSCVCGAVSTSETDIFKGETKGSIHDFTKKVETEAYLVEGSVATCDKGAEYYYSCATGTCGAKGTATFFSDVTGSHDFEVRKDADHMIAETCSKNAFYYKYCTECDTFADELPGFENEKIEEPNSNHRASITAADVKFPAAADEYKYLINNADCLNDALYSKICVKCGEPRATKLAEAEREGIDYYEKAGTAINPGHYDTTKLVEVERRIEPTCTENGLEAVLACTELDCKYKTEETIIPAKGHTYTKVVAYKEAKCGVEGNYGRKYCAECNKSFFYDADGKEAGSSNDLQEKKIAALKHANNNGDDLCDICNAEVKPSDTCTCICHQGGFMFLITMLLRWIWQFTGTNQYCRCSSADEIVKHY